MGQPWRVQRQLEETLSRELESSQLLRSTSRGAIAEPPMLSQLPHEATVDHQELSHFVSYVVNVEAQQWLLLSKAEGEKPLPSLVREMAGEPPPSPEPHPEETGGSAQPSQRITLLEPLLLIDVSGLFDPVTDSNVAGCERLACPSPRHR